MFARIFVCAIVLQVAFSSPQDEEYEARIVGGSTTTIDQHPYQVAVAFSNYICAGTLIYPNIVLTAAQCTQHSASIRASAKVIAGSSNFNNGYVVSIFAIYDHPNYGNVGSRSVPDYDVSILHLAGSYILRKTIQTIPIAQYARASGATCVVTGWGNTNAILPSLSTNALKSVEIPFISIKDCRTSTKYVQQQFTLTDRMICAGKVNKNACSGDTGGPLVNDGELVGVYSWARGCATADYPGVFTDVFYFKDWINSVTFSINGYYYEYE